LQLIYVYKTNHLNGNTLNAKNIATLLTPFHPNPNLARYERHLT